MDCGNTTISTRRFSTNLLAPEEIAKACANEKAHKTTAVKE